ncbi:MAG TPA: hypothetical protein VFY73_04105 [Ideonella sp.]|uniref:hypothetical protein n=1 Tax=Ideonella sp. TaxID=1929293 RepID=UPI002E2EC31B|nr:hypothetical protein [Ideonella sp.]HEX5683199.1 hypothetical protein [Ideonella sp.]
MLPAHPHHTGIVLLAAGLSSVITMSWTNFAIDSSFKSLLLAPAAFWLAGIASLVGSAGTASALADEHGTGKE